jgi:excisionase family DNA binding protein
VLAYTILFVSSNRMTLPITERGMSSQIRKEVKRQPGKVLAPKWDDRDAFSVEEAGEILGIGRVSAYAAARKGGIPIIRIGRRCIVPRLALERLLGGIPA